MSRSFHNETRSRVRHNSKVPQNRISRRAARMALRHPDTRTIETDTFYVEVLEYLGSPEDMGSPEYMPPAEVNRIMSMYYRVNQHLDTLAALADHAGIASKSERAFWWRCGCCSDWAW